MMTATRKSFGAPRRLLANARLRELTRRTNRSGYAQCLLHAALIAATAGWVAIAEGLWRVSAMLALGITLVALFAPLHEASHRTVFESRWPNRALTWIAGWVLILPPSWFRQFHLAHHRYTQDPQRDPELGQPKPETLGQYLWLISGIPFWRDALVNLGYLALGQTAHMAYLTPRERPAAVREARVFVITYAVLALAGIGLSSAAPLIYWLIPVVLGQPFLRLFLLAEHTGCSQTADGLTNTRTTLTSLPIRALMWNMSYHTEHHLYPAVPFHALPRLHGDIKNHLRVVAPSYPGAHRDIRRQLARRV